MMERLNKEILRRTKVVGVFPSMDSYLRQGSGYLIEYGEELSTSMLYIYKVILEQIRENRQSA